MHLNREIVVGENIVLREFHQVRVEALRPPERLRGLLIHCHDRHRGVPLAAHEIAPGGILAGKEIHLALFGNLQLTGSDRGWRPHLHHVAAGCLLEEEGYEHSHRHGKARRHLLFDQVPSVGKIERTLRIPAGPGRFVDLLCGHHGVLAASLGCHPLQFQRSPIVTNYPPRRCGSEARSDALALIDRMVVYDYKNPAPLSSTMASTLWELDRAHEDGIRGDEEV